MKKKVLLILFLAFVGLCGLYSKDLKQINKEEYFLTDQGKKSFFEFQKSTGSKSFLLVNKVKWKKETRVFLDTYCLTDDQCNLFDASQFSSLKFPPPISLVDSTSETIAISADEDIILKNIIPNLSDENTKFLGLPYTNYLLDQASDEIGSKLFPMVFGLCAVFILLLSRSLLNTALIFIPMVFSALFSLSLLKLIFGSMNMITSISPVLVFVINTCLGLHIFSSIGRLKSLKKVLALKKTPIIKMVLTTALGLFSLYFSKLEVVRDFGLLSGVLVILTSIFSIIWFYLVDDFFNTKKDLLQLSRVVEFFSESFSKYLVAFISLGSLIVGTLMFNKIPVLTDATKYFDKDLKISETLIELSKKVVGIPLYTIKIDLNDNYNDRVGLLELESKLIEISKEYDFKMLSENELVKNVNREYSGELVIPNSKISYFTLLGQVPNFLKSLFPTDKSTYIIQIMGAPENVDSYTKKLNVVKNLLQTINLKSEIGGLYYHLMISQKEMINTLFRSFFIGLLLIVVFSFIIYRDFFVSLSFLIVNLAPIGLSLVIMKLLGLTFNIATVMTYSISLGIIVDSSFHLIHQLKNRTLKFDEYKSEIILPILLSSIILIFSFLVIGLHHFLPIKEFGINLAVIMSLGLLFDCFILPTIVLKGKKVNEVFK